MSLTETSIFSFLCLCRWQKHLFSLFHACVVDRNTYFLFFTLMSLTETPISLFRAYVVDRNTYFLFFMLMSLTETLIFSFSRLCRWQKRLFFSIYSFWNVQKHEKPPFALSEAFKSMKNLHLLFLKRSEARKTSIWPFWNVQKHEKPPFALSETFRNTKTRKLFARLPYNLYFCMQMKIYLT